MNISSIRRDADDDLEPTSDDALSPNEQETSAQDIAAMRGFFEKKTEKGRDFNSRAAAGLARNQARRLFHVGQPVRALEFLQYANHHDLRADTLEQPTRTVADVMRQSEECAA
jgi:hypothetical protein